MPSPSTSRLPQAIPEATSLECLAVRAELDAYVDGELREDQADIIDAHVQCCAGCRAAEAALRRLLAVLAQSQIAVLASRRLRLRVAQLFAADDPEPVVARELDTHAERGLAHRRGA